MEFILKHTAMVGICCHSFSVSLMFFIVAIVMYRVFFPGDLSHNLRETFFCQHGAVPKQLWVREGKVKRCKCCMLTIL